MASETALAQAQRGGAAPGRIASALTLLAGVALTLMPKCPLCVAAYLSLLGIGAATGMSAASALSPWLLPLGLLASAGALLWIGRPAAACCRRSTSAFENRRSVS